MEFYMQKVDYININELFCGIQHFEEKFEMNSMKIQKDKWRK
jgi:hypothetical protein